MSDVVATFAVVVRQRAVKFPIPVLAPITVDLVTFLGEMMPDGQLVGVVVLNRRWDHTTIIVDNEAAVPTTKVEISYRLITYLTTGSNFPVDPWGPEVERVVVFLMVKNETASEVENKSTSATVIGEPSEARLSAFVAQVGGGSIGRVK